MSRSPGYRSYDDASRELTQRYEQAGLLYTDTSPAVEPLTDERERQADAIADLEDRLEQRRQQDWPPGQDLTAAVEAAAQRRPVSGCP